MPIEKIDKGELGTQRQITPLPTSREVTTGEVISAFNENENVVFSLADAFARPKFPPDPNYDRFKDMDGYEGFADDLNAQSAEEMAFLKSRIDEKLENDSIIASATFPQAMVGVGSFVASDPSTLIPLGGAVHRTYRSTGRILEGAGKTAAAAAAIETGREAFLQHQQPGRTEDEAIFNITAATMVGGLLGGAGTALSSTQLENLAKNFEQEMVTPALRSDSTAGAERAGTTIEEEEIAGLNRTKKIMRNLPGFMRSPTLDGATSKSLFMRQYTEKMTDLGLLKNKNLAGRESELSVELAIKGYDAIRVPVYDSIKQNFENYRKRVAAGEYTQSDLMGKSGKAMTRDEFEEQIDRAIANNAEHQIEEVRNVAQVGRQFYDDMMEHGIQTGLFDEGLRDAVRQTSPTFAPRNWKKNKILREADRFKQEVLLPGLKKEQRKAQTAAEQEKQKIISLQGKIRQGKKEAAQVEKVTKESAINRLYQEIEKTPFELDSRIINDVVAQTQKTSKTKAQKLAQKEKKLFKDKLNKALNEEVDDIVQREFVENTTNEINDLARTLASDGSDITDDTLADALNIDIGTTEFGRFVQNNLNELRTRVFNEVQEELKNARFNQATKKSKNLNLDDVFKKIVANAKKQARQSATKEAKTASQALKKQIKEQTQELAKTKKNLRFLQARSEITEEELDDLASDIIDRITNATEGRIPYDLEFRQSKPPSNIVGKQGSANRITLDFIKNSDADEWIEHNFTANFEKYVRSVAPDMEILQRFGSLDFDKIKRGIQEDYKRLIGQIERNTELDEAARNKEIFKLKKEQGRDIRTAEGIFEKIRGTRRQTDDYSVPLAVAERFAMAWNFVSLLGDVVGSSVPDMSRTVMVHGFNRSYGDLTRTLISDIKGFKMAASDVTEIGTALDMTNSMTALKRANMDDFVSSSGRVDEATRKVSQGVANLTGINIWNSAQRTFAGVITQNRMLEGIQALARGEKLSAKEIANLASHGINREMAQRINAQFTKHGEKRKVVRVANARVWDDRAARDAFRAAIRKQVDEIIVNPGFEKPLWLTDPGWKMVGQFKSFNFGSMQRVFLANLQQADRHTMAGVSLAIFLGMNVYAYKQMMAGREISDDPRVWITEGVDRSGIVGWTFDVNNIIEKATRGTIGINALTGGPPMSRYAARNVTDAMLGPTIGKMKSVFSVTGAAFAGDVNENDIHAARRLLPAQNIPYLRGMFDKVEEVATENLVADE